MPSCPLSCAVIFPIQFYYISTTYSWSACGRERERQRNYYYYYYYYNKFLYLLLECARERVLTEARGKMLVRCSSFLPNT